MAGLAECTGIGGIRGHWGAGAAGGVRDVGPSRGCQGYWGVEAEGLGVVVFHV